MGSNGQAGNETKAGSKVLLEVAGVLLGAFAAAHSSSSTARLGEEYVSVREELLGALLVQALQFEARGKLSQQITTDNSYLYIAW